MNSAQHYAIRGAYAIYKALYDVTDQMDEQWNSLTKEDLVKEVMVRTRGTCNPAQVRKIIDEL